MPLSKQLGLIIVILCVGSVVGTFLWSILFVAYVEITQASAFTIKAGDFGAILFVMLVACMISVPATLCLGVPMFFVLRKYFLLKWWIFCGMGVISGAILGTTQIQPGAPLSAILGLIIASIVWALILRSNIPLNPDASPNGDAPVS